MEIRIARQAPRQPHAAFENRRRFDAAGTVCVNLLGPPNVGKTALLEAVVPRLARELRVGVLMADTAGTCDTHRIAALGVPVVQVITEDGCHLRADQVRHAIVDLSLSDLDLLLVENSGSLVCQGRTDIGEHLRVAVMSATGGGRAAEKYAGVYGNAAVVVVTKADLLPHVDFDVEAVARALGRLNPGVEVICVDSRRGGSVGRITGWVLGYVRAQRVKPVEQTADAFAGTFSHAT